MEIADKELVAEFVVESQEGLANIENQMLTIESNGTDVDTDLVNAVFRTMHSIKGDAGFLGLDRIGSLAHSLEEILNNLRNREMIPTSELVTTMLRAADYMKGLIEEVETSNDADVSPYISELQQFRLGGAPAARAPQPAPAAAEPAPAPAPVVAATPSAPMSEATREFLIECYENLDQMDRELVALEQDPEHEQLLRNVFRTIHTIKGGAGFLGLGELEKLTHAAEDLLGKLRSGDRRFNAMIGSALLATVDKCREGLKMVEDTGGTTSLDPKAVIEQLRQADSADAAPAAPKTAETAAVTVATTQSKPTAAATTTSPQSKPAAKADVATTA